MALYIDPPRWPAHGTTFSHLVSDTSYIELHALAAELGVPRRAFDADHYDVPARLYEAAVAAGAIPVEGRDLISILRTSGLRVPPRERAKYLHPVLIAQWAELYPRDLRLGEELLERWNEEHRSYHNLTHLAEALRACEDVAGRGLSGEDLRAVKLGIWFHDAVYEGAPGEDEENSALMAEAALSGALGREVARLVRLTAAHSTDAEDSAGLAMIDSDLAILAAPRPRYTRYVQQVRDEYAFIDDSSWRVGRAEILAGLIGRDSVFLSGRGREAWEVQARLNLNQELASLL